MKFHKIESMSKCVKAVDSQAAILRVNQTQHKHSWQCHYSDDVDIVMVIVDCMKASMLRHWLRWVTNGHMKILISGDDSVVMLVNWQKSFGYWWIMGMWGHWKNDSSQTRWKWVLRWMRLKLHLASFTKFECTYREVNTESISKTSMNGIMMQCGTVLTGKVWSLDACLLDLWNESRLQRVCMVGSIQANRNQRYPQMPSTCISAQDAKSQMKCRSTFWNADMLVLMQKDMILFVRWWGRYNRTTYVQPKKCLLCVSGPGLNLWKQLYRTWAVHMNCNVNSFERQLMTKNALVGT